MKTRLLNHKQLAYYCATAQGWHVSRETLHYPNNRSWVVPGKATSTSNYYQDLVNDYKPVKNKAQSLDLLDAFKLGISRVDGDKIISKTTSIPFNVDGITLLEAICLAVVLDTYGEEVEEID